MSTKQFSYAAMASKHVAKPLLPTSSEMFPDELAASKKATTASSSAAAATPTTSSLSSTTSKQNVKSLNGNINGGGMNSMTEDFPPIEGQIPAQNLFKNEPIPVSQPKTFDLEKNQTASISSHTNDKEKSQTYKERPKEENGRGKRESMQAYRNNSGKSDTFQQRKPSNNLNSSRTSASGEPNPFLEKLREEEEALRVKYKTPKENLCFTFTKGDLFSAPPDASLAHCVSEDFRMGKGIATEFKKRFEGVNDLLSQNTKTGGCAYLKRDDRFIFYLVTKKYYSHKPYYNCLENSLKALLDQCKNLNVTKLAMPMIGSGLDKLEWDLVSRILDDVFTGSLINMTVYKFEPEHNKDNNRRERYSGPRRDNYQKNTRENGNSK